VVVTHDMRLVERSVADRVIISGPRQVIFLGTPSEMERSSVPLVQQFLLLDRIGLNDLLSA